MLDELRIEEQMELLKRIARLTEQGKIDWKCEEYNPLSLNWLSISQYRMEKAMLQLL